MHYKIEKCFLIVILLLFQNSVSAQDLDPRAYLKVPVDVTLLIAGFQYTYGDIVLDPAFVVKDLGATVESPMLALVHTFSLFGLTSQAFAAFNYSWAQLSGTAFGEDTSVTRSGFGDTRFRISTLFFGAPATTLEEFAKSPSSQIVIGTSITVIAPTGQFFSDKIINLGTNRWSIKPELGLSYMMEKKWFIDLYTGVWFFTNNNSFYPGNSVHSQDPLFALQTHLIYNFTPLMWAAFDYTYYTGGQSSVNGVYNDNLQNNSRLGATFNFPVSKLTYIKIAYSTGVIVRSGQDFSTISIALQTAFH